MNRLSQVIKEEDKSIVVGKVEVDEDFKNVFLTAQGGAPVFSEELDISHIKETDRPENE